MKIVMADPSLFTGRYDDSLCAALAQAGHEVTLAGRPLRPTDGIAPRGYDYASRFFRRSDWLPALGGLRQAVKAADYLCDAYAGSPSVFAGADVVHWQWLPFAHADRQWLHRLSASHALVHTVHNARPFHGDGRGGNVQARGYFALVRRFDALVVHGEETRAALIAQGIDPARIHIIAHPPMRLAEASAADLSAVPASVRPRLLFFGTIRPYKGLDLLVEAALTLWAEGLDFDLAVAGQPFMPVDELWERVRAAGRGDRLILDLGFLTEGRLDAHLRRADMIAFPYRHIDSSGAFLSALGYGAAMITSDAGMFARLPDGIGARFRAGDGAGLADALRPLLADADARARAGEAGRALMAAMGSWDDAARLTVDAYTQALAAAQLRGVGA